MKLLGMGISFVMIFLSGFWLAQAGKPHNVLILTLHKLVSVGLVVFLVISVLQIIRMKKPGVPEIVLVVITALLFLVSIISGGLISTEGPSASVFLLAHRISPFLTLMCTFLLMYFLFWRK
jgi:hypothetical protein